MALVKEMGVSNSPLVALDLSFPQLELTHGLWKPTVCVITIQEAGASLPDLIAILV